jgi:serine/threonine-protein kinase
LTRYCPECETRYEQGGLDHCPEDGTRLRVLVKDTALDHELIGRVLEGRWQIKERLGQGGMGTVFLATQKTVDRKVAVKMLKPALSSTKDYAERFMREANVATSLNNPHCVTVYDFGQTHDGLLYLAMELLEGRALADVLRDQHLCMRDVLTAGSQICSALAAAHQGNIVHRDLKPDNIFLVDVPGGGIFCKVLDFGIAKVIDNDETPVTQTGQIFGTPAYMSPEQCHSADVDQRSDLYSLGIILYELVSGRPPFNHSTPIKTLMAHINSDVQAPSEIGVPVPDGFERIILTLLEKEADQRYATALDVRRDLEALIRELTDQDLAAIPARGAATPDGETVELVDEAERERTPDRTARGVRPGADEDVSDASGDSGGLAHAPTQHESGSVRDQTETADRDVALENAEVSERGWSTGLVVLVAIGAAIATAAVILWSSGKDGGGAQAGQNRAMDPTTAASGEAAMPEDEATVREPTVALDENRADSIDREAEPSIGSADEATSGGVEKSPPANARPKEEDESNADEDARAEESVSGGEDHGRDGKPERESAPEETAPAAKAKPDDQRGAGEDESPALLSNILTTESANRVIKSHDPEIRRCYQKGLVDDADFGGEIEIKMVISDAGEVVNSKLVSSEVDHAEVETCVVEAAKTWSFPKPADGFYKTLTHSFMFGSK